MYSLSLTVKGRLLGICVLCDTFVILPLFATLLRRIWLNIYCLYILGSYYYYYHYHHTCYHLYARYLQLYTQNKPCLYGTCCCSCSVFTVCCYMQCYFACEKCCVLLHQHFPQFVCCAQYGCFFFAVL